MKTKQAAIFVFFVIVGFWGICWAESAMEHFQTGQSLLKHRKYQQAIEAFDQALTVDPGLGAAYLEKGFAHRLLGNYENAKQAYQAALALNQNDAAAHLRLGEIYVLLNEPDAAEAEFAVYRSLTETSSN